MEIMFLLALSVEGALSDQQISGLSRFCLLNLFQVITLGAPRSYVDHTHPGDTKK